MLARRVRALSLAMFLAGGFVSGGACSGEKNTELVVAVQTDLRVPKDLDSVTVRVVSFGALQHEDTYEVGPGGLKLPATIGIVPKNADDLKPIDIEIIGHFRQKDVVIRKARLTFAKDRVGLVRLPIKFSCYDQTNCGDGLTCVAGKCETIPTIEGASLPAYTHDQVFGAGSQGEGQLGTCWDGDTCLAATQPLAVTSDPCVYGLGAVDAPGETGTNPPPQVDAGDGVPPDGGFKFKRLDPSKPLSVVVAKQGSTLGFCNGSVCRIALDQDPAEGWDYADATRTTIRLAPGICQRATSEKWAVLGTDACATKIASMPYCETSGGTPTADGGVGEDASVPDGSTGDFCAAPPCPADPVSEYQKACNQGVQHPSCATPFRDYYRCATINPRCDGSGKTDNAAQQTACSGELQKLSECLGASDSGVAVDGGSDPCGPPASTPLGNLPPLLAGFRLSPGSYGLDMVSGTSVTFQGTPTGFGGPGCPAFVLPLMNADFVTATGIFPKLLEARSEFVVSVWIEGSTTEAPNAVLLSNLGDGAGWALRADATGKAIVLDAFFESGMKTTSAAPISSGWHRISAGKFGTGFGMTYDGALVGTPVAESTALRPTDRLGIGRHPLLTAPNWSGEVGDIRIYGKL